MKNHPRHALARAVKSLPLWAKFAVSGVAVTGTAVGGLAMAGAATSLPSGTVTACVTPSRTFQHVYTTTPSKPRCTNGSWRANIASEGQLQKTNGKVASLNTQVQTNTSDIAKAKTDITNLQNQAPSFSGLQADAPYSGSTLGASQPNSDTAVPADGNVHVIWTACPAGKTAIAGGYRIGNVAEAFQEDGSAVTDEEKSVHVVDNGPAHQTGGQLDNPAPGSPGVTGPNDSLVPNAWETTAYNDGSQTYHVRTWVVCADVSNG